ncbi:Arabinogalactan protein 16/20/22/41 [Dioscorea alata]|uniref:Arabinogalactan protein 16/20/22/41 n=1 Tax=Dioscorea alata TaxID=55571 RepID=A0ACB7TU62_DIOAL|nr:Arabinogalactan protein 16/20/22/41 [Dioscorea alata]
MSSIRVYALLFISFFLSGLMQISHAQETTTYWRVEGKAIDQGIAYVLMLVALLVTYLVH